MRHSRFFAVPVLFAVVLASCSARSQPLPVAPASVRTAAAPMVTGSTTEMLFVASATPYFVNAYALPLTNASTPVATISDVNEPVPLAVAPNHLFVGSFDDGDIVRYHLPLSGQSLGEPLALQLPVSRNAPFRAPLSGDDGIARAAGSLINVGAPSGLAVGRGFLYVAGANANGNYVVQAYARPISPGAHPSSTLYGYGAFDFIGLAAADNTLFVASTAQGTIRAYPIPLTANNKPRYTLQIGAQSNAAIGAAARNGTLYVTDYSTGDVLVFSLRNHAAPPLRLNMKLANGGTNPLPYAAAVDDNYLYVTAGSSIYEYKLPVTPRELPAAVVQTNGFLTGLAIYPRWLQ